MNLEEAEDLKLTRFKPIELVWVDRVYFTLNPFWQLESGVHLPSEHLPLIYDEGGKESIVLVYEEDISLQTQ